MKHIFILIIVAVTASCSPNKDSSSNVYEDPFYNYKGDIDYIRLPLKKPYSISYINGECLLLNQRGDVCLEGVVSIAIDSDYIFIHTNREQAWRISHSQSEVSDFFAIDIDGKRIAHGASFENLFLQFGLANEGSLDIHDPEILMQRFQATGSLPWKNPKEAGFEED